MTVICIIALLLVPILCCYSERIMTAHNTEIACILFYLYPSQLYMHIDSIIYLAHHELSYTSIFLFVGNLQ